MQGRLVPLFPGSCQVPYGIRDIGMAVAGLRYRWKGGRPWDGHVRMSPLSFPAGFLPCSVTWHVVTVTEQGLMCARYGALLEWECRHTRLWLLAKKGQGDVSRFGLFSGLVRSWL